LRTIGRYRQLQEHHLRPHLGTLPLSALSTLQRLYDQLAQHGRKDGKEGGLGPRTIRQLHLCLHQALGYAMKWHGLPANPAADAEPPAIPAHTPAALTPEQVGILLAAAQQERRPWLRAFTVLAAATGARTGELCALEWHDLDLEGARCGSARRCPASTSSWRPAGRVPTAPAASYWSSAPSRPPPARRS
jgi:integrase